MKNKLIFAFLLTALVVVAQTPQTINYQGVARDAYGVPIVKNNMTIKFEILQGSSTTPVMTETQSINTNSLGLFSTQIGKSKPAGLTTIDFDLGGLSLRTGLDTTGGNNFIDLGVQKLVSVPYAMHAQSIPVTYTSNILTIGTKSFVLDQGTAPTLSLLTANTLSITNGNSVTLAPSLGFTNNVLTVGPSGNTISIPSSTTGIKTTGVLTSTQVAGNYTLNVVPPTVVITTTPATPGSTASGNTININIPSPTIAVTTTPGLAGTSTLSPNLYNINIPPAQAAVITNTGVLNQASSNNNFTLGVDPTNIVITNTPGLGGSSSSLPNNFVINIPSTPLLSTQGVATQTSSGGNFTVGVAPTSIGLSTNAGAATLTNPTPNVFQLNIPPAITPSMTASGLAIASQVGNTLNINVPLITYTPATGSIGSGTNVTNITQAMSLSGTTLTSGPTSNSVNLSVLTPWRQAPGTITLATSSDNVGIGTNAPTGKLEVVSSGTATSLIVVNSNVSLTNFAGSFDGGIYTKGKNNLSTGKALQAQNAAGTDLLVLNNLGNTGISVSNPTEKLDVSGNIKLSGALMPGNASGTAGQLLQSNGVNLAPSWVTSGLLAGGTPNYIPKWTSATGLSSTSQMYDNGTNVGLGTNNPQQKLDVNGILRIGTTSASSDEGWLLASPSAGLSSLATGQRGSAEMRLDQTNNGPMTLRTNATERLRILGNGNIGVGITTPSNALSVGSSNIEKFGISGTTGGLTFTDDQGIISFPANSSTVAPMISMFASGTSNAKRMVIQHGPSNPTWGLQYDDVLDRFHFLGANAPVLTIDLPGANVGIGTFSPAEDLQVESASSSALSIVSAANTWGNLAFGVGGTTPNHFLGNIRYDNSTNTMDFWTNNTPNRLVINNQGYVGIGSSAPLTRLEVTGTSAINGMQGQSSFFHSPGVGSAVYAEANNPGTSTGQTFVYSRAILAGYNTSLTPLNSTFNADVGVYGFGQTWGMMAATGTTANPSIYVGLAGAGGVAGTFMGGNVGIGTSAPTRPLHVAGSVRIADGTEGLDKVLTSDAQGNASWQNSTRNTGFAVYSTSAVNASSTFTQVPFAGTDFNDGNFASNVYTAPTAGVYQFNATVSWNTGMLIGGYTFVAFYKNGSAYKYKMAASSANYHSNDLSITVRLNAGETIGVFVSAFSTGTASTYVSSGQYTHFSGFRVY